MFLGVLVDKGLCIYLHIRADMVMSFLFAPCLCIPILLLTLFEKRFIDYIEYTEDLSIYIDLIHGSCFIIVMYNS
jgi:ABC-type enterochelin transport system permease subunit